MEVTVSGAEHVHHEHLPWKWNGGVGGFLGLDGEAVRLSEPVKGGFGYPIEIGENIRRGASTS